MESKLVQLTDHMCAHGASVLTDAELLTIILGQDLPAQSILSATNNSIKRLCQMGISEIARFPGMTKLKAAKLVSSMELGRRKTNETIGRKVITTSSDIGDYLIQKIGDNTVEIFYCMFLNRANKVVFEKPISTGGITGTVADPRVILKLALEYNAVSIILAHNHPSDSLKPSRADEELTVKIKEAAKWHDIKILDHVIVSQVGFFSFADEGLL